MSGLCLGKRPARYDKRTIPLRAILAAPLPAIPTTYRRNDRGIPTPMFANDQHGDCVIAGRAHQTLRFERTETKRTPAITDKDVLKEYYFETDGEDSGLVMLYSMNLWRQRGWKIGRRLHKIEAYASIAPKDRADVRAAIYLLNGIQVGLWLPLSAQDQLGETWDVVKGPRGRAGSWGGHCVTIYSFDPEGLECVTWGKYQRMSWAFFEKYCDEAFAVVDAVNPWTKKPGIDVQKLKQYLAEIKAG